MHAGGVGLSVWLVPAQGGGVANCLDHSMNRHIQSGTALMFQLSSLVYVCGAGGWEGRSANQWQCSSTAGDPFCFAHDLS